MQNMPPESLAEATYKYEIIKLADQNLDLSEKCDKYAEEVKKYKKMLKVYIKRSRSTLNNSKIAFFFSFFFKLNAY